MLTVGESLSQLVFPAPAGMNRVFYTTQCCAVSVPRACGDEPSSNLRGADLRKCSPRLRG